MKQSIKKYFYKLSSAFLFYIYLRAHMYQCLYIDHIVIYMVLRNLKGDCLDIDCILFISIWLLLAFGRYFKWLSDQAASNIVQDFRKVSSPVLRIV
jgi:hypothetical protein